MLLCGPGHLSNFRRTLCLLDRNNCRIGRLRKLFLVSQIGSVRRYNKGELSSFSFEISVFQCRGCHCNRNDTDISFRRMIWNVVISADFGATDNHQECQSKIDRFTVPGPYYTKRGSEWSTKIQKLFRSIVFRPLRAVCEVPGVRAPDDHDNSTLTNTKCRSHTNLGFIQAKLSLPHYFISLMSKDFKAHKDPRETTF